VKGLSSLETFLMPMGGARSETLVHYAFAVLVDLPTVIFEFRLLAAKRDV